MMLLWCYQANKKKKTMYHVALDILLVHVSSVPSECVFSLSKETNTLGQNNLSSEMMEELQILKFTVASGWMDVNVKWVSTEEEIYVPMFSLLYGWSFHNSSTPYQARITSWLATCIDSWQVTSVNHRDHLLTSNKMHVIMLHDIVVILCNCLVQADSLLFS